MLLAMRNVLALILGGGQGSRLHPLTQFRSKPAVPIGGKYRLIDVPISNCLHADLRRIFVLTQFNSASLNRHVSSAYRMDLFSRGFVEILAAEQTPESTAWFQGTADAVRKAQRHFIQHDAEPLPDPGRRSSLPDELRRAARRRISISDADVTIAALPVDEAEATGMGIFTLRPRRAASPASRRSPTPSGCGRWRPASGRARASSPTIRRSPFIASMGIYLFSREVLLELLAQEPGHDFGRELIPAALTRYKVRAYLAPRLLGGCRHHRELLRRQHHADPAPSAPFSFYDPTCPVYTHARFLPPSQAGALSAQQHARRRGLLPRGRRRSPIRSSASAPRSAPAAAIERSVLLGADYYEPEPERHAVPIGIGRDVVLDRVIVDKNARIGDGARLVNTAGLEHADGNGYYIRNGIIIVPKDGTIAPGTVV